jgi:hypothetical protein
MAAETAAGAERMSKGDGGMTRTTLEVLTDHLNRRQAGDVEGDLAANYSEDVVYLCMYGRHVGHEGVRTMANLLATQLPDAEFQYPTIEAHEDFAFCEWTGLGEKTRVDDGADSYLIRDGRIVAQTVHYTIRRR